MRTVGRIASLLLVLVVVPLLTLAACNYAIEVTMTNPDTYTGAFDDEDFFDDLLPVVFPAILSQANDFNPGNFPVDLNEVQARLDTDDWRAVLNVLVPPEWIQARYEQFVEVALATLQGDFDLLQSTVDFGEIRRRFLGPGARRAAESLIAAAPTCTLAENARVRAVVNESGGLLPVCQPTNLRNREMSVQTLENWFNMVGEQLPTEPVTTAELFEITLNEARGVNLLFELDQYALALFYLCPLALLALIVVFAVRSLRGFGLWFGFTAITAAVVLLLVLSGLQFTVLQMLSEALQTSNEAERFAAEIIMNLARSIALQSSSVLFFHAVIYLVIGAALFALALFARTPESLPGNTVIITDDGQIISTTAVKRSSSATIQLQDTRTR